MEFYQATILLTVSTTFILYLFIRFPQLKEMTPLLRSIIKIGASWLDKRGFDKMYKNALEAVYKFTILTETLRLEELNIDSVTAKYKIAEFVRKNYIYLYEHTGQKRDEEAEKIAAAGFSILVANKELRNTITALLHKHPNNVEVKKVTILAIDVLGACFDLKDKLSLEYFQHLIYAINKILLILRQDGLSKKATKRAGAIMFRMYKITKAYKHLKNPEDIEGLYKNVQKIINMVISK